MPSPVTISDVTNTFQAGVGPQGSLSASVDPQTVFNDPFDGASVETTNRWTTGGTVPPTLSGTGNLLVNPGTAASASSSLVSQTTFPPDSFLIPVSFLTFEAVTATGNHRFFGLGTQPGGWTAATPLQDAIGFEVDTAGVLRASIYAGGVRVLTQALSIPKDGFPHFFYAITRAGASYFYMDGVLVAALLGGIPQVLTLPLRYHSINGLSITVGTPTLAAAACAVADLSRPSQAQSDGQFPWRRQTIYPQAASFSAQVNSEGQRATYRYTVSGFTPVATPTAFVVIQGSATRVIRIKRIFVSGVATAAGNMPLLITRRSTAGTLGAAVLTAVGAAKHDTNDAAATAVVSTVGTANYTTLGTANGQLAASRIGLAAVGSGVADTPALYEFATRNDKPIILRGATDFLTLEGAGAAVPAGGALDIEIETEEDAF